jgi:hypothetical protein
MPMLASGTQDRDLAPQKPPVAVIKEKSIVDNRRLNWIAKRAANAAGFFSR